MNFNIFSMRSLISSLLFLIGVVKFTDGQFNNNNNQITATIPDFLRECYNDSWIRTPDNLLPMNVPTFIALLRKAENDYNSRTANMKILSNTILKMFRMDGLIQNPSVQDFSPGVIPVSASGDEFYLYRILFSYLMPDQGGTLDNGTFSRVEKCTLHRMVSLSVYPYLRDDNDNECSQTTEINSMFMGRVHRPRRSLENLDDDAETVDLNRFQSKSEQFYLGSYDNDDNSRPRSSCPVDNSVSASSSGSLSLGLVLAGISSALAPTNVNYMNLMGKMKPDNKKYGEPRGPSNQPRNNFNRGTNVKFPQNQRYPNGQNYPGQGSSGGRYPIGNQGYQGGYQGIPGNQGYPGQGNPGSQGYPGQGNPGNPGYPGQGNPGNQGYPGQGYPGNQGYPSQGNPGQQTPTGQYPMGGGFGGYGTSIDNSWASTFSGILAESAILSGPLNVMDVGVPGGWNDTVMPKYYLLNQPKLHSLSEARIRGALDGLIMAKNIQNWNYMGSGNMKLSQIFSMYYGKHGVFDKSMRSCNRKNFISNTFTTNDADAQTFAIAEVLKDHLPISVTMDSQATAYYSEQVVTATSSAMSAMNEPGCQDTSSPQNLNTYTVPAADLIVVLDCRWDYTAIKPILQNLMEQAEVQPFRSNITIIMGKGNAQLNSTFVYGASNILDAQIPYSNYTLCPKAFDMGFTMVQIQQIMISKMNWDRTAYQNNQLPWNYDIPRVVIFLPSPGANVDSNTATFVKNKISDFKSKIPDIKLLFLVPGAKESFSQFADDSTKDIFTLQPDDIANSISPLITRITQLQRRIENPNCGGYWTGSNDYGTMQVYEYISYGEIHYFRVHPNYFFSSTSGSIVVQPSGGSVTVCTSRTIYLPSKNSSSSATCRSVASGSSYTVSSLSSLCTSSYATQCSPIYFSVQNNQAPSLSSNTISQCTDDQCEFPDMLKYKISHQGLTCYSSAFKVLPSLWILFLTVFSIIFATN